MNHVFCTECGNKIEYSYSKPKFCSGCGSKFGGASLVDKKSNKIPKNEESLAEDETSIDEVPDIKRLEVDLEQYNDNVFTFGSLAGDNSQQAASRRRGSSNLEDFIDAKRR